MLCAWLMLRPTTGPFPQISQRFAMMLRFVAVRGRTAGNCVFGDPDGAVGRRPNAELYQSCPNRT